MFKIYFWLGSHHYTSWFVIRKALLKQDFGALKISVISKSNHATTNYTNIKNPYFAHLEWLLVLWFIKDYRILHEILHNVLEITTRDDDWCHAVIYFLYRLYNLSLKHSWNICTKRFLLNINEPILMAYIYNSRFEKCLIYKIW
jgi:hypothetical protein